MRDLATLLADCENRGVRLSADADGGLAVSGPSTPALREKLRAHKQDIIRILRDAELTELLATGWQPKRRSKKMIWARPCTGFWCSEESALIFVERASKANRMRREGAPGGQDENERQ